MSSVTKFTPTFKVNTYTSEQGEAKYSAHKASPYTEARFKRRDRIKYLQTLTLDDWTEEKRWKSDELEWFGTLMITQKPSREYPMILTSGMYAYRLKHEIYTVSGTPDPSIYQGCYWRTHPAGRRWQKEHPDRSFYKK